VRTAPRIVRMDRNIQVSVRDGIVRTVIKGDVGSLHSAHAMELAASTATKAHTQLLLFDITHAVYRNYHAPAIEQARSASRTGMIKFRIAILGKPGDPRLPYFENVAVNRGIRARAFTLENDAVAWLQAAKPGGTKPG
jgi:hypothetical protein